jgi:hypothetical protein
MATTTTPLLRGRPRQRRSLLLLPLVLPLLLLLLATSTTAASAATTTTAFNNSVLLAPSVDENQINSLRLIAQKGGPLARDARTAPRQFFSPVLVCVTAGCLRAVAPDSLALGGACDGECLQLGGRRTQPFSLVGGAGGGGGGGGGSGARWFEFSATWPRNTLFTTPP